MAMTIRPILTGACLVAVTAIVTTQVVSQDKPGQPPAEPMPEWMKYSVPGEHHKRLDGMVGKWNQSVKFWMEPAATPEESTGTVEYKWILGGRYIQGTYTGTMGGSPFEGIDLTGYDNFRGEYVTIWLDNMSTSVMVTRGKFDPATKTFAMAGKMDDIMAGKRDQPVRTVSDVSNKERSVFSMFCPGPDGKEYKCLEVTATRAR